jgi:hypothetical protein
MCEGQLCLQLIEPVVSGTAPSFEVKEEVTDKYNDMSQYRLSSSVFTLCPLVPRWQRWKSIQHFPWAHYLVLVVAPISHLNRFNAVGAEMRRMSRDRQPC